MSDENKNSYSSEAVKESNIKREKLRRRYNCLLLSSARITFDCKKSENYLHQGYFRRISLIQECINNIYSICPIDDWIKVGDDSSRNNLTINLQAIIINVSGCLDNLVKFYVYQKGCSDFKRMDYAFFGKKFKNSVSNEFKKYLERLDREWNRKYFKEYRDSLAHRVPLYVPPNIITDAEKETIESNKPVYNENITDADIDGMFEYNESLRLAGSFMPIIQASFESSKTIMFHGQILDDFAVALDAGENIFDELKLKRDEPYLMEE
jgi:hypothetical protein